MAKGLAFRPRPSDLFIATYAKAGTTWMQQIVHGLRTGGDMAFGEITEVVPWVEMAFDLGLDPEAEQVANPRAYKTHLSWPDVPKGGRYIAIVRHPYDIVLSLYRFMDGWFFETGSIGLDEFIRRDVLAERRGEDYWGHVLSWWQVRGREDVLLLTYESMKADLDGTVRRVADWIGLPPESPHIAVATAQASFDYMKAHAHQFDDNLVRRKRDPACGLPPGGDSNKAILFQRSRRRGPQTHRRQRRRLFSSPRFFTTGRSRVARIDRVRINPRIAHGCPESACPADSREYDFLLIRLWLPKPVPYTCKWKDPLRRNR